jgi:formylglycine-generating enzyme required for sulfatase activity
MMMDVMSEHEAFEQEIAPQKVALFERQFGKQYRLLAYHAALPLVLTPELVHYLRTEFLLSKEVPWEAEADLLLSDLCSQVGYELYAMDSAVRSYLLTEMKRDPEIPEGRIEAVARVLISYVTYLSQVNPGQRVKEIQAQRWAAMSCLGDDSCRRMVQEIAEQFEMSAETGNETDVKAEFARLARITQELEGQLLDYPELVEFGRQMGRSIRSPQTLTLEEQQKTFRIGDRSLQLPGTKTNIKNDPIPGLPDLKTLEFDVAEFVEGIEVRSQRQLQRVLYEFEIATIEVKVLPPPARRFWQRNQETEPKTEIVIHRKQKQGEQYLDRLSDNINLELIKIPKGSFLMGSPEDELESYSDERPQHEVNVPEFYMGKYPVTQAQWRFVANLEQVNQVLDEDPSKFKGDLRPVEKVSWLDAVEFCARLSRYTGREYRLPSEAEWEYACRAGTTTPFHFGETIDAQVANYQAKDEEYKGKTYPGKYGRGEFGEYRKQTIPVDQLNVTNEFGLCDMHGNVWEWCMDHWHEDYKNSPPIDGSAWLDENAAEGAQRLLRGGSWFNSPRYCRSACRIRYEPDNRLNNIGFRVSFSARTLGSP